MYIQYIQSLFQPRLGTADYALVTSSLLHHDSLDTWTVVHMTAAKLKPLRADGCHIVNVGTVCVKVNDVQATSTVSSEF
jgi:hypothetical protein